MAAKSVKTIGVLTSGGDAPGMNACVRSVVRTAIHEGLKVKGIMRGYAGLLQEEIVDMDTTSVSDTISHGGTILYTARCMEFTTPEGQQRGAEICRKHGIDGIVVVGGDGSFRGGVELAKRGIKVMGVPGTIDNDLGYTDYTIGFDTAVNTILGLITNIRDTSSSHERSTIIEVMGRHCGDLALHSGIAGGADVILVPEVECDINEICRRVLEGQATGKGHSLIVMAEGFDMDSSELAKTLEEMTGREARTVVPGYIQRGGSPTEKDRLIATMTAAKAVDLLYDDEDSKAVGVFNGKVVAMDLQEALEVKGEFNRDLYDLANVLGKGR